MYEKVWFILSRFGQTPLLCRTQIFDLLLCIYKYVSSIIWIWNLTYFFLNKLIVPLWTPFSLHLVLHFKISFGFHLSSERSHKNSLTSSFYHWFKPCLFFISCFISNYFEKTKNLTNNQKLFAYWANKSDVRSSQG